MKTKTMKDIQATLADLLEFVQAVQSITNALSVQIEIKTEVFRNSTSAIRLQINGTTYLQMLDAGLDIGGDGHLPAGNYRIGPNMIKEIDGTLHAAGSLYYTSADGAADYRECITDIEITACSGPASDLSKESPSYRAFLKMYANAEQSRLQKMLQ